MNGVLAPTEQLLVDHLQTTPRGPRRNGIFALWLLVRVCDGLLPPSTLSQRANRRRIEGLKKRFSSLTVLPPLRRALNGSIGELERETPDAAFLALGQLVAPVQDALGSRSSEALAWAADQARATISDNSAVEA